MEVFLLLSKNTIRSLFYRGGVWNFKGLGYSQCVCNGSGKPQICQFCDFPLHQSSTRWWDWAAESQPSSDCFPAFLPWSVQNDFSYGGLIIIKTCRRMKKYRYSLHPDLIVMVLLHLHRGIENQEGSLSDFPDVNKTDHLVTRPLDRWAHFCGAELTQTVKPQLNLCSLSLGRLVAKI